MKNKELKDFVYNNVYQNSTNGYVLTPSELAFEMISKLPESVFESGSTTFLDPICKSGTFLFEIVEKLYDKGHSIKNIESRIYTIDSNFHSLNVAQSTVRKILNKCSGSFKVDYKNDWIEKFYNRSISVVSKGKYTTFDDFLNIILLDKNKNELMTLLKRNISDFIQQYEKVSKLESKLFGEVFTPRQLIEEMLDSLPVEVWTNKDLKWLDPAVGIGNFPSVVLDRLMLGLEEVIPNEGERRKHILEEMLYMCDISIKNLFLLYKLFDCNNEFKLNVHRGSFLEDDFKDKMFFWNIEKFDIILGNPPYQETSESEVKNSNQSSKKLWMKFIDKSLLIGKDILFVTPNNWLSKTCYLSDLFKSKIKYAEVNSDYLRNKYFKSVGSTFSFYILSEDTSDVEFSFGGKKIQSNILELGILPTKDICVESISIFQKLHNRNCTNLLFTREKYSNLTNYNKTIFIDRSKNNGFRLSDDNILSTSSYWYECSSTNEVDTLLNNLNTKFYKFIIKNIRSGMAIVSTINLLPIYKDSILDTNQLYEYFNLTQEEIDLIEKTIKD